MHYVIKATDSNGTVSRTRKPSLRAALASARDRVSGGHVLALVFADREDNGLPPVAAYALGTDGEAYRVEV